MKLKQNIKNITLLIAGILILNWVSSLVFKRFDLTQDKRYTLSEASKNTLTTVDSPIIVDVFLKGTAAPEFKRLKEETEQLLASFTTYNQNVRYEFINPLEDEEDAQAIAQQLASMGLTAAQVEVKQNGKTNTEVVYPWALATYQEKTVRIPLLKNQLGATTEDRVSASIQNLEYAFADGFSKLSTPKRRKVAVLKGNGELDDRYVADFFASLKEYYFIAPFTLDSVASNPQKTLNDIAQYDLLVIAQPSEAFSEQEKYVLDQFTMQGGSSLWLLDATQTELDTVSGKTFAVPRDLNLSDFFFKYGLRINRNLVKDIYAAPITLATGSERESQYSSYPWFYHPLSSSANNHPIVTNIEGVKFEYASSIDTLNNGIDKTILLSSSPVTKLVGLPAAIDFDKEIPENLRVVNEGPDPNAFPDGEQTLAVLLEGSFTSVYKNRVKPVQFAGDKTESSVTKMVVISDGNIIKNQLNGNRPLELGFDKFTSSFYGNKEFLLNTVNYLLDDSGLINIRTKEIAIPFLDVQKASKERTQWQVLNLVLPLGLLLIFGVGFTYFRKKKYAK